MNIPFVDLRAQYLSIKREIDEAISQTLEQSAFIGGSFVRNFEASFAKLYGVKHVIGCANGTDALYIVLKMLGVGSGDEVITPANSWISSSETITQAGARPVFIDVHPEYYSLDETQLETRLTGRTRAVIAVHLHGQAAALDRIKAFCDRYKLFLIEDCAQAHFSQFKGRLVGLHGVAGCFSFYPGKNLGAYGDAGCVITDDDGLATRCRMFANHGALTKPDHQMEGVNSRLDGIQAAILGAKLPHVAGWTTARIYNAALYRTHLEGIAQLHLPPVRPDTKHTFHLYVVRTGHRDALRAFLKDHGIETSVHYPVALPNLPAYMYLGHTSGDFPVASRLQAEILSLPMYPELTEEMIAHVAATVRAFWRRNDR